MKPRPFLLLAGLALGTTLAAVVAVNVRDAAPPADAGVGEPLIPGLAGHLNQVTVMTLVGGGHSVTLARSDPQSGQWAVVEKAGYPADPDQVRRAIVALAEARTLEPRTADPAQYPRLALGPDATAITLRGADGAALPVLILGKTVTEASPDHPGSFYARRAGEGQSWLAEGRLPTLSTDALSWLPRTLPSMLRGRVASVTVSRPGSPDLVIRHPDANAAGFAVAAPPHPGTPRPAGVDALAGAAEFLTFEDVAAADPKAAAPDTTTAFRSTDGETLTIRISHRDGQAWATLAVAADATASPEARQRTEEAGRHLAGWRYRLPDTAAGDIAPTADSLFDTGKPAEARSR